MFKVISRLWTEPNVKEYVYNVIETDEGHFKSESDALEFAHQLCDAWCSFEDEYFIFANNTYDFGAWTSTPLMDCGIRLFVRTV